MPEAKPIRHCPGSQALSQCVQGLARLPDLEIRLHPRQTISASADPVGLIQYI
jgi:hypothetical protein